MKHRTYNLVMVWNLLIKILDFSLMNIGLNSQHTQHTIKRVIDMELINHEKCINHVNVTLFISIIRQIDLVDNQTNIN